MRAALAVILPFDVDSGIFTGDSGLSDHTTEMERRTMITARELAIQVKASGPTDIDAITSVVDAWCPELTDAEFEAMCREVEALAPTVPYVREIAAKWAVADAAIRAEAHAERVNFSSHY